MRARNLHSFRANNKLLKHKNNSVIAKGFETSFKFSVKSTFNGTNLQWRNK